MIEAFHGLMDDHRGCQSVILPLFRKPPEEGSIFRCGFVSGSVPVHVDLKEFPKRDPFLLLRLRVLPLGHVPPHLLSPLPCLSNVQIRPLADLEHVHRQPNPDIQEKGLRPCGVDLDHQPLDLIIPHDIGLFFRGERFQNLLGKMHGWPSRTSFFCRFLCCSHFLVLRVQHSDLALLKIISTVAIKTKK